MREFIKKAKAIALDSLFPVFCFYCQEENSWICQKCLKKIELLETQICPYCEKVAAPGGRTCPRCLDLFAAQKKFPPLDTLIVSVDYKKFRIDKIIHHLKYKFIADLSQPLGEIMANSFLKNNLPLPDFIVPVPLHPRRLRWRGFNQSELLASHMRKHLSPGFSIEILKEAVQRERFTPPQMKIESYQARKENLKNSFRVPAEKIKLIQGKTIILVDDVATTGATLFECARTLKEAGVQKVYGAVIARQKMN